MSLTSEAASHRDGSRVDAWSARMLGGPLTAVLIALCVAQLASWIPHYLTWPWWADADVFFALAREWSLGSPPYRAVHTNNFPGPVYLAWIIGTIAGWGRTAPFYAADALLVICFGLALLAWSRRLFGRFLPGAASYAAFVSFYLGLNYTLAAQRDWHTCLFALLAIFAAQAWPGRVGRIASGLGLAIALGFRPQAVLFVIPALLAVVLEARRGRGSTSRGLLECGAAVLLGAALMFAPIVAAGLTRDFLESIRVVAYGGAYNQTTARTLILRFLRELATRDIVVLCALALLYCRVGERTRSIAIVWAVTWISAAFYLPVSPQPHTYLRIPVTIVSFVLLGVLVHAIAESPIAPSSAKLLSILLAAGLFVVIRPEMALPGLVVPSIRSLSNGTEPIDPPPGYRKDIVVFQAATYPWNDYRNVLTYLRQSVSRETRVANMLLYAAALTGPTAHRPAFPAESIAWLLMVARDDEAEFAAALERAEDSVVVWVPDEFRVGSEVESRHRFPQLERVVRRLYHPEARFGAIEVWRRTPRSPGRAVP
jgi:hypothetical protein